MIINILNFTLGPVIILGPVALGIWVLSDQKCSLISMGIFFAMFLLSILISYHMLQNFYWVKIEGDKISGIKFWSRKYLEFNISDIERINIMRSGRGLEIGYEITFKNSSKKLYVAKGDMKDSDLLMQGLYLRKKEAFAQPFA